MPRSRKYLRPEFLPRLRGLELRARRPVTGSMSGMHRSVYKGYSVEFAEHRPYVAGDDLRHIDWRLFGRKDRFFIKQYEEETSLQCHILVDASKSMAFGSTGTSKFEYACYLAATLAYLVLNQHDKVGLLTFDHEVRTNVPAMTGRPQLGTLLKVLENTSPNGETDVKILFHRLAEELKQRSLVVMISDLLAPVEDVVGGLEHIAYSRHELVVMHVMDPQEWSLPFVENVYFEGMEDEVRLLADPQSLRESYLSAVRRFCARVRTACLKHQADYVPVNTRDAVDVVLAGYLSRRSGQNRGAAAPVELTAGGESA